MEITEDKIVYGNNTFTIVNEVPNGYKIWNIGPYMIKGFVPLCRLRQDLLQTIENWGLLKPEITVDTLAGQLVAYAGKDLDNPSVGIYFKPLNGGEVDLAMAEVQGEELCEGTDVGEKDIVLYKWEYPFSEDYTSKTVLREKDIKQALD